MAYNYLDVTNEVLARFNEVELSASNFTNARGFQIQCKNAINAAIRQINQKEYGWPFNHQTASVTLVAGQTRYDLPANTKLVDYETFRIAEDPVLGSSGRSLRVLDYKEYIDTHIDQEDKTDVGEVPRFIFRDPANKYGLYPYPDQAYTLRFDYYTYPEDLVNATDTPSIPERFRHVLVDGAVMYGFQYRGETQQYQLNQIRFEEGIKNMQSVLLNRYDYVRSTYVPPQNRIAVFSKVV